MDSYSEGDPHAGRLLTELRDHLRERNHLAVGFVVSAIDVMLAIRAGRHLDADRGLRILAGVLERHRERGVGPAGDVVDLRRRIERVAPHRNAGE